MSNGRFKKIISVIMACVGTALLVVATFLAVVEVCAFDRSFYQSEYEKIGTASYVGTDEETLTEATDILLDYLTGERDNIDMRFFDGQQDTEFYNEREKAHMVDVAVLNQNAVKYMVVFFAVGGVLLVGAFLLNKKKQVIFKTCFFSILGVLTVFFVLALWIVVDFETFWTQFHHVFFTNDLWLLDPETSRLIRMFSLTFFFDLVGKILAWFLGITITSMIISRITYKRLEKQCKKNK